MEVVDEPYWFWVVGFNSKVKVKVNFGTLCHLAGLIQTTLHLQIVNDERKNPIDFEPQGQRSMSACETFWA